MDQPGNVSKFSFVILRKYIYLNNCFFSHEFGCAEARMPVERDAEEYNMSHPRRGKAIIINNDVFDNNFATPRKGSQVDVSNLEKAFLELGFEVTIYDNYTYQEIKSVVHESRFILFYFIYFALANRLKPKLLQNSVTFFSKSRGSQ